MARNAAILTHLNLHDYFHAQLEASLSHQGLMLESHTRQYLARLLANFTDPRQLFERTDQGLEFKPLALHYADAVLAEGSHQRNLALKRLGDIALFISGMFGGSLARKVVDIDYYAAMGGTAYRSLHDAMCSRHPEAATHAPFAELAQKFLALIDVLGEIAEESHLGARSDALRDYEVWLRTGSQRALGKLQRAGIVPSRTATSLSRH